MGRGRDDTCQYYLRTKVAADTVKVTVARGRVPTQRKGGRRRGGLGASCVFGVKERGMRRAGK